MAVVSLEQLVALCDQVTTVALRCSSKLKKRLDIQSWSKKPTFWQERSNRELKRCSDVQSSSDCSQYGTVIHPVHGQIYAFEVVILVLRRILIAKSGGWVRQLLANMSDLQPRFGSAYSMDDANVPSLLSLPYLGFCTVDDKLYQNTRKFILSPENPYFFKGSAGFSSIQTWHWSKSFKEKELADLTLESVTSGQWVSSWELWTQRVLRRLPLALKHWRIQLQEPDSYTNHFGKMMRPR